MAHGSKKWIKTATGRMKKSKDRTKKDYWGEVYRWDEDYRYSRAQLRHGRSTSDKSDCPQCRHVEKYYLAERAEHKAVTDALRAEYDKGFGEDNAKWAAYEKTGRWMDYAYVLSDGTKKSGYKRVYDGKKPKCEKPPHFWDWSKFTYSVGRVWNYDGRSLLCFKHERMYDLKWDSRFWKENYPRKHTYARRQEYREYRSEVKTLMQRAKFDDQYYDSIVKKKNGWLD